MRRGRPRNDPKAAPTAPRTEEWNRVALITEGPPAGKSNGSRDMMREILAPLGPDKGLDYSGIEHELVDSIFTKAPDLSPLPEVARLQMRALVKDFLRKHGHPLVSDNAVLENVVDELLMAVATSRR